MAPPAQALLTSLTANVFFGPLRDDKDAGEEKKKDANEDAMLEFGGVEIIVNTPGGDHSHAVYPHFRDKPDSKHVAYPAFDHAHAVYPHFDDKPSSCSDHRHVAYPAFDHAHAVYPHFDDKPEKVAYPAFEHTHAVSPDFDDKPEMVAYPASDHAHAVYPHFNDEPTSCRDPCHVAYPAFDFKPGGLIGETLKGDTGGEDNDEDSQASYVFPYATFMEGPEVSSERLGAHALNLYPIFESSGRLMGDKMKDDAIIGHDGVEIIAKDGPKDSVASAVYPHFGDRPEHGACAHTFYSMLEDKIGGLIGDEPKDDAIIGNLGVEIIASNHGDTCLASAVYPFHANDSEAGLLGAHALYRAFGEDGGGLMGVETMGETIMKHDGVEITAKGNAEDCHASAVYPHFGDRPEKNPLLGAHALYPAFGENSGGLIGDKVIEYVSANGLSKDKVVLAEITGQTVAENVIGSDDAFEYFSSLPPPAPNLSSSPRGHAAVSEKDKEVAGLLAAFFSLPRDEVLRAMTWATSIHEECADRPGIPQHTCTGCGIWDEQCKAPGNRIPAPVAVAS